MAKKIILTEEQHTVIINEILRETVQKIDAIEADGRLDEGFWDSVKYGLSKLGRYKANGKILGKSKIDQEAARKIQQIIDKEGNELIKNLDATIREKNPEFPNSKDPQQFLTTVMEIAAIYDSIVAATQKSPEESGYMPIDAANGIINDLRDYTKKFLDTDLAAVYSGFDENEDKLGDNNLMSEEYNLDEEQLRQIDEYFGLNEAPQLGGTYKPKEDIEDANYEEVPNDAAPQNADLDSGDVRAGLQAKRGGGEDFDSTRMDTLKSNKLPMILAGAGAALGALGWIAQTEWFKTWLESVLTTSKIVQTPAVTKDIFGGAPDAKGFVHWADKIGGKQIHTGADMQQFINKYGAGNVSHMFDGNGAGDSMGQVQKLQQLISSNPHATMTDLFNKANQTFGSAKGVQNLFSVEKAGTFFAKIVVKQATKSLIKTTGTALVGKIVGLGPILAGVGIGLLATGALVKLVRIKGQKSSRAATLNALYQSMRGLDGGVGIVPPPTGAETATDSGDTTGAETTTGSGENPTATGNTGGDVNARTGSETGNGIGNITGIGTGTNTGGGGNAIGTGGTGAARGIGAGDTNTPTDQNAINDEIYNDLKNLFQFIVNNKKSMGDKTEFNTGTSGAPLTEGKFINDKTVIQYLTKTLGADKIKNFENLLTRIEYIRNVLKKMAGRSTDENINKFLKELNSNPIMLTKFTYLTEVDPRDPQDVKELSSFINEVLLAIYSGNYKFGNMVDKMSTLGGGNINKLTEDAGYNAMEPNEAFIDDANSTVTFKKNLINFLTTVMGLFQYLHKTKGGEIARQDTSQKYTPQQRTGGPRPKQPQEPQPDEKGQYGLDLKENQKLMEELKRIKKIMLS